MGAVKILTFVVCVRQPLVSVLWFRGWRWLDVCRLTLHGLQAALRLEHAHRQQDTKHLSRKQDLADEYDTL